MADRKTKGGVEMSYHTDESACECRCATWAHCAPGVAGDVDFERTLLVALGVGLEIADENRLSKAPASSGRLSADEAVEGDASMSGVTGFLRSDVDFTGLVDGPVGIQKGCELPPWGILPKTEDKAFVNLILLMIRSYFSTLLYDVHCTVFRKLSEICFLRGTLINVRYSITKIYS